MSKQVYMRLCPCPRISGIELTKAEFIDMQNIKQEFCKRCMQPITYIPPKDDVDE